MSSSRIGVAVQASYSERGVHPNCLSCGEFVVHPVCPCCIAKGYAQWIYGFSSVRRSVMNQLSLYMRKNRTFHGTSQKCVSCKRRQTHVCPLCFTDFLYKITKEAGIGPTALAQFLFIFNFDFERKSYAKELEVMGGY